MKGTTMKDDHTTIAALSKALLGLGPNAAEELTRDGFSLDTAADLINGLRAALLRTPIHRRPFVCALTSPEGASIFTRDQLHDYLLSMGLPQIATRLHRLPYRANHVGIISVGDRGWRCELVALRGGRS